jgi:hypothetical protein
VPERSGFGSGDAVTRLIHAAKLVLELLLLLAGIALPVMSGAEQAPAPKRLRVETMGVPSAQAQAAKRGSPGYDARYAPISSAPLRDDSALRRPQACASEIQPAKQNPS